MIKIKINTITPILIRSADDFSGLESLFQDRYFYLFSIDKILARSSIKDQFKKLIDEQLEKGELNLSLFRQFYQKNFSKIQNEIVEQIPLNPEVNFDANQTLNLFQFIRYFDFDQGKNIPYLPGSSLKGAFLDFLFTQFPQVNKTQLGLYLGFTDFYFTNFSNQITRLVRYNPEKKKTGVKIYAEVINGTAQGEIFFPKRMTDFDGNLEAMIKNAFANGGDYYLKKRHRFMSFFSPDFVIKIKSFKKGIVLPLGFGSGSFEKEKKGKTYFSFCQKEPFDPLGVIYLTLDQ